MKTTTLSSVQDFDAMASPLSEMASLGSESMGEEYATSAPAVDPFHPAMILGKEEDHDNDSDDLDTSIMLFPMPNKNTEKQQGVEMAPPVATESIMETVSLDDKSEHSDEFTEQSRSDQDAGSNSSSKNSKTCVLSPSLVGGLVDGALLSLQQEKDGREVADPVAPTQLWPDRAVVHVDPKGFKELCHALRTYHTKGITASSAIVAAFAAHVSSNGGYDQTPLTPNGRFDSHTFSTDDDLLRRMQDFHRARFLRRCRDGRSKASNTSSFGVFGLLMYVADLRLDLEWAVDAAWRRRNDRPYLAWDDFESLHHKQETPAYFCYMVALVWAVMLVLGLARNDFRLAPLSDNPMVGPPPYVLRDLGALDADLIVNNNEWYRLVSAQIINAGVIQFALNYSALVFIGGAVEQVHGFAGTALVFIICGIGSNVLSALFVPGILSVGPAGGLFGLLGVCVADILTQLDILRIKNYRDPWDVAHKGFGLFPLALVLLFQVLACMFVGLAPLVDNFAHIGGFTYGVIFSAPLLEWLGGTEYFGPTSRVQRRYLGRSLYRLGAFAVAVVCMGGTTWLLATGVDGSSICPRCHYISCVTFPWWTDNPWWLCDACILNGATGSYDRYDNQTVVNVECPEGEWVNVTLPSPNVTVEYMESALVDFCRQHCLN